MDKIQAAIDDYQFGEGWPELLNRLNLAILVAPSASGRTSVINELVKTGAYTYVVSDTTRQPREVNGVMEQDGVEYFFRSEAEVLADINSGEYLGLGVIEGNHFSGISKRELQRAADSQTVAITELNTAGADQVKAQKPETSLILMTPPSFDIWMERLNKVSEMTTEDIQAHLEVCEKEIEYALQQGDYNFVVNDQLPRAIEQVRNIVEHQAGQAQSEAARDVVWRFLSQVKQQLYS